MATDGDIVKVIKQGELTFCHFNGDKDSTSGPDKVFVKLCNNLLQLVPVTTSGELSKDTAYIYILESVSIQLLNSSEKFLFPFLINFGPDAECLLLSSSSEKERTDWIYAITKASKQLLQDDVFLLSDDVNESLSLVKQSSLDFVDDNVNNNYYADQKDLQLWTETSSYSPLFDNAVVREFRFISTLNEPLCVQEAMFECKLSVIFPQQYMKWAFYRQEMRLSHLKNMFYLKDSLEQARQLHINALERSLRAYKDGQTACDMMLNKGMHFKARDKQLDAVQFLPTNLHVQRIIAHSVSGGLLHWDLFTSGAWSNLSQGFVYGGIPSMLENLHKHIKVGKRWTPDYYWQGHTSLIGLQNRLKFLKGQILETTANNRLNKKFASKWLAEVWSVLSELKEFADTNSMQTYVDLLSESFAKCQSDSVLRFTLDSDSPRDVNSYDASNFKTPPLSPTLGIDFDIDCLDNIYGEIENHMACIVTKVTNLEQLDTESPGEQDRDVLPIWVIDLRKTALIVLACLEKFARTLLDAWNLALMRDLANNATNVDLYHAFELRLDSALSQSLSVIVSALAAKLWLRPSAAVNEPREQRFSDWIHYLSETSSFVILVNSLLSVWRDERGMLEDMSFACAFIRQSCRVKLVRSFSVSESQCLPVCEGRLGDMVVLLPIPSNIFDNLPDNLKMGATIKLIPLLLNQGVNDEQTLATKLGDIELERIICLESMSLLEEYLNRLCDTHSNEEDCVQQNIPKVRQLLELIKSMIGSGRPKCLEIFHHASYAVQELLYSSVVFCCKSGKDRTSMAVTLEEAFVLQRNSNLPEISIPAVIAKLRKDGTRRVNVKKNVLSTDCYAFSGLATKFLPDLYRPPPGTFRQGAK